MLMIEGDQRVVDYVLRHQPELQSRIDEVLATGTMTRVNVPITQAGIRPDKSYHPVFITIEKNGPNSVVVTCTTPDALPGGPRA